MHAKMKYATSKPPESPVGAIYRNIITTANGHMLFDIIGILLPFEFLELSDINPTTGSTHADHIIDIIEIVPAIAGDMPATLVR